MNQFGRVAAYLSSQTTELIHNDSFDWSELILNGSFN